MSYLTIEERLLRLEFLHDLTEEKAPVSKEQVEKCQERTGLGFASTRIIATLEYYKNLEAERKAKV